MEIFFLSILYTKETIHIPFQKHFWISMVDKPGFDIMSNISIYEVKSDKTLYHIKVKYNKQQYNFTFYNGRNWSSAI